MIIFINTVFLKINMTALKCPNCNTKKQQFEVITTEIGLVRWLHPKINRDGTIKNLGEKCRYEGGETSEEEAYGIICKNCGEVIKKIE